MSRLILLAFIIMPLLLPAQNKINFINEKIDFSIDNKYFIVNGIYCFYNNSDKEIRQTILFPFSETADSLQIKRVYNLTYLKNIFYKRLNNNSIIFKVVVLPKRTVDVNIAYSQKTDKENTYILKSTQTWGKPLQKAEYSLSVDNSVVIDSLSVKPDSLSNSIYYWSKTNFYPNKDFTVWIK